MDSLQQDLAAGLFNSQEGPCLSLYQPTHRRHPENQQDPIRFRNLVKALKDSLLRKYPTRQIEPLLDPFVELAQDRAFWDHTLDGLAVLGSPRLFRVYPLKHQVKELAVVADRFHTKPLLRSLQTAGRYQILGLNRSELMLFEGDREMLAEIEPAAGVPRTMTAALGEELTESHLTVASYGGSGSGHSAMHHGHGDRKSETAIDDERYFRAVDSAVLEHHSRPSALPLILATLPEHRQLFRSISRNPFLMDNGIDVYPRTIPLDALRQRAREILEPHFETRTARLVEEFGQARSADRGAEELPDVAKAVVAGRVAVLLIEADREVPGRIDSTTGNIEAGDLADPEIGDVLADLAMLTLKLGGRVEVLPSGQMPGVTGAAAICRY